MRAGEFCNNIGQGPAVYFQDIISGVPMADMGAKLSTKPDNK
jgi:hypothetical protein